MNDVLSLIKPPLHPSSTTVAGALMKIEPGTRMRFTRRGMDYTFEGTIQLVIADAIIYTRLSSDNPIILRIDAIDTLELIHE